MMKLSEMKLLATDGKLVIESDLDNRQVKLKKAIENRDWQGAETLLRLGADVNFSYPPFGNTLLLDLIEVAAYTGQWRSEAVGGVLEWLISHGALLNKVNLQGNSAMIMAASYGDYELLEKLYKLGANVNAVNIYGESVFTVAAAQNILTLLLELVPMEVVDSKIQSELVRLIECDDCAVVGSLVYDET